MIGCINWRSIAMGEDEIGNPALYFASKDGNYRLGTAGLQYLGHDVEDVWASRDGVEVFGVYYQRRKQYYLYVRSISGTTTRLRFHVKLGRPDDAGRVRGGWVKDSGTTAISSAVSAVMAPYVNGLVTTDESIPRPYVLSVTSILAADTGSTDNAGNFQGYAETPPLAPAGLGVLARFGPPVLVGKSSSGTPTMTVTQLKNYGAETPTCTGELAATRTHVKTGSTASGGVDDCHVVAYRIGDGAAQSSGTWIMDALVVAWQPAEEYAEL